MIVDQEVTNQVVDMGLLTQTAEPAGKDEFRYDAERDAFICPAGQVLSTRTESKLRELTKIDYSNRAACLVCAIKSRCTKDYRKVSRLENEAVLDRMAARRKARPAILDRRREMVAHPFGSIKQ